ncbi:MAG: hypothetical protein R3F34_14205 [Planctomycetota bacterium]
MLVQSLELLAVAPQRHRDVPRERRADRVGADVRVAVHVAADPRREVHDGAFDRDPRAVRQFERLLELLVQRGDDAVEHLGQEEEHVLDLVRHGGAALELLVGLPGRRDLERDALVDTGEGPALRVGEEALDERLREALVS